MTAECSPTPRDYVAPEGLSRRTEWVCFCCKRTGHYGARGLCRACYRTHRPDEMNLSHPRLDGKHSHSDVLAEIDAGIDLATVAQSLGIKPESVARVIDRYRKGAP